MELEQTPPPLLNAVLLPALSDHSEASPGTPLEEEFPSSTYKEEHAKQDIVLSNYFTLNTHILENTTISENMRARIRSFLILEGAKQWVMRDTMTLALTYIDLYFLNKGYCSGDDFQCLAIGCLILAMKISEGKFTTISFKMFNKQELLNWEKNIAKRLSYRLSPPTYATLAEHIAVKWCIYTSDTTIFNVQLKQCTNGFNPILRRFYEQLDFIMMVLQSLNWPLQTLVVNLFYLHARTFNLLKVLQAHHLDNQEFISSFYPEDEFQQFFERFLIFYSQKKAITLDKELGLYLKNFLMIEPSLKSFGLKKEVEDLRIWDKLQTVPKQCYARSKAIIEKLNPRSKRK